MRVTEALARFRHQHYVLAAIILVAAAVGGSFFFHRRSPTPPTAIFDGIIYGCEEVTRSADGSGLVHWAQIDLATPGLELYVTPLDPDAVENGWQYKLRHTREAVDVERLSIGINATLFDCPWPWLRLPGQFARSVETTVSDHRVSHIWEHTYLLWFDDRLRPRLKPSKPPKDTELAAAKWAIGGQGVGLVGGVVRGDDGRKPQAQTAVGIDAERNLLVLLAAERITPHAALQLLKKHGAKDGMLLDGGGSTSMTIGKNARGVRPGTVVGGWRPVATHFGIRTRQSREIAGGARKHE
jgi:hypothetical protein